MFKQSPPVNDRAMLHLVGAAMMEAVWNRRAYVLPKDITGDIDAVRDYVPEDKRLDSVASLKVGRVMSRVCSNEKSALRGKFFNVK